MSPPTGGVGSSAVSRQRCGKVTGFGPCMCPRGSASACGGRHLRRVERVEQLVELGERGGQRHQPAAFGADGIAGEVPADVLAEVADAEQLVALGLDEQPGVAAHHGDDLAERAATAAPAAREGVGEVAEQPRPAEAAAADDDAVAAGLGASSRRASSPVQMSPLPSTGVDAGSASRRRAIADQSARPE